MYIQIRKQKITVTTLEEASAKWCQYRDQTGAGVSKIGNGVTVKDANGQAIATISYNGRIWRGQA